MRMTLRQLAVFTAIAQEGTVTKASDAVRLTQSAASMALADLESALESPLFDRVGKRLQLNELGHYLLPQALEILGRCESFEQAARSQQQDTDLKLGATLTISDYIMPDLMSEFLQQQPQAQLYLQVGNTTSIIEAVAQFQLDIGFIEGSCYSPQLDVIPWHTDHMVVCCASSHPLAAKTDISVADLKAVQWVLREQGSGTREVFDKYILPTLDEVNMRLILGHNEAVIKVVKGGFGVCCISRLAVQRHLDNGDMTEIHIEGWALTRQLFIIMHKQKYQSPGLKRFLAHCTP